MEKGKHGGREEWRGGKMKRMLRRNDKMERGKSGEEEGCGEG